MTEMDRTRILRHAKELEKQADDLEKQADKLAKKDPPDKAGAEVLRSKARQKREGAKDARKLANRQ